MRLTAYETRESTRVDQPHAGAITALLAASGFVIVVSLVLTVLATRHTPHPASSPLEPTDGWSDVLRVALPVAFVAYTIGVAAAWHGVVGRRLVCAAALLIQLLPLGSPLLLSSDTYIYWAYGRIAAQHGANPYASPPSAFPSDPAYAVMSPNWHHATTLYGPLFTWISELVARLVSTPHAAELAFRALAAASMVALVLLLAVAGASCAAIVLVGWSPIFALHFAGGGHNDALMMALAVGALSVRSRRPWLSAALWVAAVAVKWVAAVFLALELLLPSRGERAAKTVRLAIMAVVGALLATLSYGGAWLHAFRRLSNQARHTGSLGPAKWLTDAGLGHREILVVLGLALLVTLAALAVLAFVRGRRHLSFAGTAAALCQGWLNPWYAVWGGSLLEYEDAPALAAVASIALSAIFLRDMIPT